MTIYLQVSHYTHSIFASLAAKRYMTLYIPAFANSVVPGQTDSREQTYNSHRSLNDIPCRNRTFTWKNGVCQRSLHKNIRFYIEADQIRQRTLNLCFPVEKNNAKMSHVAFLLIQDCFSFMLHLYWYKIVSTMCARRSNIRASIHYMNLYQTCFSGCGLLKRRIYVLWCYYWSFWSI